MKKEIMLYMLRYGPYIEIQDMQLVSLLNMGDQVAQAAAPMATKLFKLIVDRNINIEIQLPDFKEFNI
jgi:hypothetical protein